MKAKCKRCGDTIEVTRPREFKSCKCGAINLDYGDGEYYFRVGGNPEDFDGEIEGAPKIRFADDSMERAMNIIGEENIGGESKSIRSADDTMEKIELPPEPEAIVNSPVATVYGAPIYPINELVPLVWDWFREKELKDPVMQMVKMQEEVGELAHEISRGRRDTKKVVDALGDILVTVIGMCHYLHIPVEAALSLAYSEIKDRKGKVIDNSFVKEER